MAPSKLATPHAQAFCMGIAFLFAFAAYDTIQVFAKRLYPGDLGSNQSMAVYIAFTISTIFAPTIVNKIGCRCAISTGICCYGAVVVSGLIFFLTGQSPALVVLGGAILGLGAGLLWTGQGRLILEYSTPTNRGQVFAIFWSLYRCASISGGILTFTYFSQHADTQGSVGLYVIFLACIVLGALATLLLKDPKEVRAAGGLPEPEDATWTEASRARDDAEAEDPETEAVSTWMSEMSETLRFYSSTPMLLMAMMFWTSGGNEPFILSGFTARWFEARTTGMEMVIYFSCSVLGSIATGQLLDGFAKRNRTRFGALTTLMLATTVHLTAFILAFFVEYQHVPVGFDGFSLSDPHVILPTVAFALWGLSDAMINSFLYWMIGLLYESGPDKARAIGWFKFLNSAAHVVGYAILPTHRVSAMVQLWYNIISYCIGATLASVVVEKLATHTEKTAAVVAPLVVPKTA